MGPNRAAAMFIGVLVCIPLLALYQFGFFVDVSRWLQGVLPRYLVLPAEGVRTSLLLQYAYYTFMAFASAWVCIELFTQWRKFAYLLGAASLTLSLTAVLAFYGILFEPFSGIMAALVAGLIGTIASGSVTGYRRHMLRRFFIGRLSTSAFDELAAKNDPKKLTERREVTVLTCRLANHIELAGELPPFEFEEMTGHFEQRAAEFLVTRGGYLETCNAQRVRVLFGYPLEDEQHALHASQIAIQFRDFLADLQKQMHTRWSWKPRFGMSLSTGTLSCGLFGFSEFQAFSAVGEAVDFGDRLCGLNGVYGSQVLISSRTYSLVKEAMEVRPMEMVYTQRLKQVSEAYELLGAKGDLNESETRARDAFWQGVVHQRKGDYKQAREHFDKAKVEGRDDAPLRYFLERLEASQKEDVEEAEGKPLPKHARSLNAT